MHRYPGTPASPHVRLSVPRLAYASRSWCMVLVAEEITTFAVQKRMFSRAAGVSPPWFALATARLRTDYVSPSAFPVPRLAYASRSWVHARRRTGGALQRRSAFTTGGLRPPLLCCNANVCRRKTIFAMHKCTSEQERRASARRGSTNTFDTSAIARKTVESMCPDHPCHAIPRRLTPPALVLRCERLSAKKRFLRCTNEHPTKSGGRQPAVGCIAPREQCTANNVGRVTIVQSRAAGVSPPWFDKHVYADTSAIGRKTVESMWADHVAIVFSDTTGAYAPRSCAAMRTSAGEKRFLRCTNARFQERRTSARRGFLTPVES
jgi:hypothetical protein